MRFSRIQRILTRRTTVDLYRPCRAAPGVQVTFARIWIRQRSRDATLFTTPEKNGIDAAEAFTSPLKTGQLLKFKNILLRNQESGCQYLRLSPHSQEGGISHADPTPRRMLSSVRKSCESVRNRQRQAETWQKKHFHEHERNYGFEVLC